MKYQRHLFTLLLAGSCLVGRPANAISYQPLASIQQTAEQHLRSLIPDSTKSVILQAETLDSRLHLAQCSTPLQAFLPSGANLGSRATVGVRCNDGNTWSVYVPVNIESEVEVLSLNKSLARNATISPLDVEVSTRHVPGLITHYLKDISELQNKRTRRDLPAGALLTPDMLQSQVLVRRGQQVTILAEVSGIEVRNQGVALVDGSENARVQVRNSVSSKVIEGVVDATGIVRVRL